MESPATAQNNSVPSRWSPHGTTSFTNSGLCRVGRRLTKRSLNGLDLLGNILDLSRVLGVFAACFLSLSHFFLVEVLLLIESVDLRAGVAPLVVESDYL